MLSLWAPVGAFMALLFHLSSRTDLDAVPSGWDKPAHVSAYAVLGVLALRACHGGLRRLAPGPTAAAVLLTVGYGVLDELHQAGVAGRHASAWDWVADACGAVVAVGLVGWYVAVRARRDPAGGRVG